MWFIRNLYLYRFGSFLSFSSLNLLLYYLGLNLLYDFSSWYYTLRSKIWLYKTDKLLFIKDVFLSYLLSLIMNMNFNRNFDFSMCTSEKSHGRKFSKKRFFSRCILAFSPQRDAFRTLSNIHVGVFLQK